MKVITVKLEEEFFKKMKRKLLNDDKTIQKYIVELVAKDLEKKEI